MPSTYDVIGINYSNLRNPDKRIGALIHDALGAAKSVLNVGAGAGSYEPKHCQVTAIEPSAEMIRQRAGGNATIIQGRAEELPFEDNSFDASMAILTIHHWSDQAKGVWEMQRVTRDKLVFLTYDPTFRDFWLLDYFPGLASLDDKQMPQLSAYRDWLGDVTIKPVPIPHDCTDGFLSAYWRRPKAYLDPRIRAAMSSFWKIGDITSALERLAKELDNGTWAQKYGKLLQQEQADCGYRLVIANNLPAQ